MTVYVGNFVDGKVVIEGDPPPDGTPAEVYVVEDGGEFTLMPDMEDEIAEAIERLDRGEGILWEEARDRIRKIERGAGDRQS